ncbi:MAG: hypothetical protein HY934_05590, partial [Candidatus Firestonebacteria bacterium]|nr:hypothetical protein [Candidatus Firestonebacteria bacterium]
MRFLHAGSKNLNIFKINLPINSFTHSPIHLSTHTLIHSFTHILIYLLFHAFIPINTHAQTYVGGRIYSDTTWTRERSPYIVNSNIEIYGDEYNTASLTINPGVEVRFDNGAGMTIGAGTYKGVLQAVNVKFT